MGHFVITSTAEFLASQPGRARYSQIKPLQCYMHLWCLMPGLSLAPLIPLFLRLTVFLKLLWLFLPSSPWGIVSLRRGDKSALITVMMMKTSLMTDTKMSDFCWRISRLDNSRKRQANFDQLVHTELLYNVRQQWLCKKLRNETMRKQYFLRWK